MDERWASLIERLEQAKRRCGEMDVLLDAIRDGGVAFPGAENAERTELTFTPEFRDPRVLLRLGLLLGEVVHQCRSALDNAVWHLAVEATAPEDPPSTTCFSICDRRRDFHRLKDGAPHPSSGRAKISILPQAVQDRIEELQPFHTAGRATPHALSLIRDLHDGDKHRVPVVTAIQTREVKFDFHMDMTTEDDDPELEADLLGDGRLRHGEPLLVVRAKQPWTKVKVNVQWDAQFRVEVTPQQVPGLQVVTSSVLTQAAGVLACLAEFFDADRASAFAAVANGPVA
jgi:hypothetical protein